MMMMMMMACAIHSIWNWDVALCCDRYQNKENFLGVVIIMMSLFLKLYIVERKNRFVNFRHN